MKEPTGVRQGTQISPSEKGPVERAPTRRARPLRRACGWPTAKAQSDSDANLFATTTLSEQRQPQFMPRVRSAARRREPRLREATASEDCVAAPYSHSRSLAAGGDNAPWSPSSRCSRRTSLTAAPGPPGDVHRGALLHAFIMWSMPPGRDTTAGAKEDEYSNGSCAAQGLPFATTCPRSSSGGRTRFLEGAKSCGRTCSLRECQPFRMRSHSSPTSAAAPSPARRRGCARS